MQGNERALGLDIRSLPLPSQTLSRAETTGDMQLTPPIQLAQGGTGFVAYFPIVKNDKTTGFLNVVFKAKPLIENALGRVDSAAYHVKIYDGDAMVYAAEGAQTDQRIIGRADLRVGARDWRVEVTPSRLELLQASSNVDEAILLSGMLLSLMTGWGARILIARRLDLERSERRFQDFATASSDWFWEMDETLRMTWLSKGIEDFLEGPAEMLLGRSRGDFRFPVGDDLNWAKHFDDLKHRRPFKDFMHATLVKGKVKWARVSGMPIYSEAGVFLGYRGTAADATELVKTRTRAEEANARLVHAVESLDELFVLWDADDKLVFGNRFFREVNADISEYLVQGTTFEAFLRAALRAGHMGDMAGHEDDYVQTAIRRRQLGSSEPHEVRRSDGRYLLLHEQRLEAGGLVTVGRDVTSEYESARALKESQERLALAVRKVSIWDWDLLEDKLYVSPGFAEALGYSDDEFEAIKRASLADIVHPDDLEDYREELRNHLQPPSQAMSAEYRFRTKDGGYRWFMVRGQGVSDADGQVIRSTGILTDVTEQVELEQKLQQAQKMEAIGNLTGGVAHDFNNLLAVIMGNLELIFETEDLSDIRRFATAGVQASRRGAELTKNMLSFARRSRLQPKLTDLNNLVEETRSWAARVLPANISIELALDQNISSVLLDPGLAQNALLNLILNARDAMPTGGKLTVETAHCEMDTDYIDTDGEPVPPGHYIMLAVSDTGEGIAKRNMPKIFDPFYTSKPTGSGSGLGLSMVQGFVKQSGGTVRVYSEVGVGTSVKLFFQAEAPTERAVPSEIGEPVAPPCHDAHLLVVEDEAAVLEVLTETLTKIGYRVTTAGSGDQAVEIWRNQSDFDLLVTDIVMPGSLQGTHLAKALRQDRPDLPVVFMSGYATEAVVHGNGLRPEDIRLMKPTRRADLVAAVEKALSQPSSPA